MLCRWRIDEGIDSVDVAADVASNSDLLYHMDHFETHNDAVESQSFTSAPPPAFLRDRCIDGSVVLDGSGICMDHQRHR